MADAAIERSLRLRATHHYRPAGWTLERSRAAFGPVADPHPHDWLVTVRVRGPLDGHGFVTDLGALDALLAQLVGPLEGADLGAAFPELAGGRLLPSTETLARLLYERLVGRVVPPARLEWVRVAESGELAGVYPA